MSDSTERLFFLAQVIQKESDHLLFTANRLFKGSEVTETRVREWTQDADMAERLDAFVARYSRLQDTLGDKLIPQLLLFLGEDLGPAVDNLDKAERFGWIQSTDEWFTHRKLRNQMIHDYIDDPRILADALDAGRLWVEPMVEVAAKLIEEIDVRTGK